MSLAVDPFMAKKVIPKRSGRPATGKDPVSAVRLPSDVTTKVDAWAARHEVSRSEAIRHLVEMGLTMKSRPKQTSRVRARKADAMAGKQLDQLADQSASAEDQASRKRRLLKGPEEFQNVRVDRPAAKK
jgi:predicted transcriptional regulator